MTPDERPDTGDASHFPANPSDAPHPGSGAHGYFFNPDDHPGHLGLGIGSSEFFSRGNPMYVASGLYVGGAAGIDETPRTRQQWEYEVLTNSPEKELGRLGTEGWELCAVVPRGERELWVFKRPVH